jgi:hypothetical protein
MGTTDVTDDTDEEQRKISGGGFMLSFLISFFISGISVIRGRSSLFSVAAERGEAALGISLGLRRFAL